MVSRNLRVPMLLLVAVAMFEGTRAGSAITQSDVVTVTPPTGIVDGPDGTPPVFADLRYHEVVYVEPNPVPTDPPVVEWHCATDAGDCGRAVGNACNATGHGAGTASSLAWCPYDFPPGSSVACCTGTCADGASVTCK